MVVELTEDVVDPVVLVAAVEVAVADVGTEVEESPVPLVTGPGEPSEPHAVADKIASPRATLVDPIFENRVCIFFLVHMRRNHRSAGIEPFVLFARFFELDHPGREPA